MIDLVKTGYYTLIETKSGVKVLTLDKDMYAWVEPAGIGDILVVTRRPHKTDCTLATGEYKVYNVSDEPKYTDQPHLELQVGEGQWQGYLLFSGLPNGVKKLGKILATAENITGNKRRRRRRQPRS